MHALLSAMAGEVGRAIAGGAEALRRNGFGAEPRFRAVLAEAGGQAVGLILFYPEYSSWRGEVGVYVQDIYLHPEARGRGLARALLARAWREAADWAPGYVTLMVDHRNAAAAAWYARQGFTLRERGDLLILQGAELVDMTAGVSR